MFFRLEWPTLHLNDRPEVWRQAEKSDSRVCPPGLAIVERGGNINSHNSSITSGKLWKTRDMLQLCKMSQGLSIGHPYQRIAVFRGSLDFQFRNKAAVFPGVVELMRSSPGIAGADVSPP
jgi:hypothetical protein